ncbi:MAG: beta-ketoacyl-ACP synthase II [bacterium]|jgi:3-oxoacyl-[acyl-carrier-protein] synthase II
MKKRVVVTGLGPITSVGIGKDEFWQGLIKGRSGISRVQGFAVADFPCQIAGQVHAFNPEHYIDKKEARRMDRFTQFAVAGAKIALDDSGLDLEQVNPERCGVILGAGIGGLATFEDQCQVLHKRGVARVSPYFIPMMIANMAAGQVSISLGFKGPSHTVTTACASSTDAMGHAFRLLQQGEVDVVMTGGSEASISPAGLAGFCAMKALSTRNQEPEKASRPFDQKRDGFVMGEGAGMLVFEELEHAKSRGAKIYAEIKGYSATCDAYHITAPAPGGEGAARAMVQAIDAAQLQPQDIDYINAHGTSTPYNDKFETAAIKHALGEHAYQVAISSTKSMTGHLLGAAGGTELIATCLTITEGMIPPTINYEYPDPDCDLDYVPNQARKKRVRNALSNSLGFGGHNATIVISEYVE